MQCSNIQSWRNTHVCPIDFSIILKNSPKQSSKTHTYFYPFDIWKGQSCWFSLNKNWFHPTGLPTVPRGKGPWSTDFVFQGLRLRSRGLGMTIGSMEVVYSPATFGIKVMVNVGTYVSPMDCGWAYIYICIYALSSKLNLLTRKLRCPLNIVVGRLLSFWNGPLFKDMLVFRGVSTSI